MGRLSVLTTHLPSLNPILARYMNTYHTDWDEYVDYVDFAYTFSHHETFRITPIFVLYGQEEIDAPTLCFTRNKLSKSKISWNGCTRFDTFTRLSSDGCCWKKHYKRQRTEKMHNFTDTILVYRPPLKKDRADKHLFRYHWPYKIVKRTNTLNYIVCSG